jgi:hypothetical protein
MSIAATLVVYVLRQLWVEHFTRERAHVQEAKVDERHDEHIEADAQRDSRHTAPYMTSLPPCYAFISWPWFHLSIPLVVPYLSEVYRARNNERHDLSSNFSFSGNRSITESMESIVLHIVVGKGLFVEKDPR